MATVFDLIGKIKLEGADQVEKELSDVDKKLKEEQKKWEDNLRTSGAIMTGIGAGITAALGFATKAAADEEAGIAKLSAVFQTMGVSYADVSGDLEKFINAQQVSTGFADDQQREALAALIPITKDYDKSLELMTLSMDLARWKGMDLSSAAELIGKVSAGNTGILARYGIVLEEGATATEALAQIQNMAAGQAKAYGETAKGQMDALTNGIGDIQEAIGGALLPILQEVISDVLPIIEEFKVWAAENPELVKTIVIIVAALGAFLAIAGPILMMLPGIIAALPILGAAFAAMTGPVGLVIAAIAALIAIGVLLYQNWDTIAAKAQEIWGGIVNFFKGVWNALISGFEAYINIYVDGINTVIGLLNMIPGVSMPTLGSADFSGIKSYDTGGVVPGTGPQLAIVHGGEEVRRPGEGTVVNIYNPTVRSDADITEITRQVSQEMLRQRQLRYG